MMVGSPCECAYNRCLPAVDKNPHTLCNSCGGRECSADDRCGDFYNWSDEMWAEVSHYHFKLAAQREKKKKRMAKASSSPSSFTGFLPSMPVPLHNLSSSFDTVVTSSIASTGHTCHVTYAASLLVISSRPCVLQVVSSSGEPGRKRKCEHYCLSSSVTKDEMFVEFQMF